MISENDAHSAKKSFFSGVALLTASALAVKLIGLFYKIPLVNLIGIEGMAYFLAAYHVYTLLFVIFSVLLFGYLLGRITIKGVSLGDAGVFIIALVVGIWGNGRAV